MIAIIEVQIPENLPLGKIKPVLVFTGNKPIYKSLVITSAWNTPTIYNWSKSKPFSSKDYTQLHSIPGIGLSAL